MNKNFEIFDESGDLPDFRPTDKPDDDETVFNSFRLCKKALLSKIEGLIEQAEKRLKQLTGYHKYVKSLLLKDMEDGELELIKEREWELVPDEAERHHETVH